MLNSLSLFSPFFFLSFFLFLWFSIMKSSVLFITLFFCVFVASNAQYTPEDIKLQALLGNLCSLNKDHNFGSCCTNYDNGASVTTSSCPRCFGSVGVTGSHISSLFVFILFLFPYFCTSFL